MIKAYEFNGWSKISDVTLPLTTVFQRGMGGGCSMGALIHLALQMLLHDLL